MLLTTYNGQKALLRDVLRARAHVNPALGEPAAVETVDRFQGQQADYVLLSLVRTRAVGHVRDVRRLVVALSRARLGLYVFAHTRLFHGALELAPALSQLAARPAELELVVGEVFPATRGADVTAEQAVAAGGGALARVVIKTRAQLAAVNDIIAGVSVGATA